MLEVTNEVDQRRKRRRNLVIHNIEESEDATQVFEKVRVILQEVMHDKALVDQQLTKVYRLGKPASPGRNRSVKMHLKCEDFCHSILQNSRNLSTSKSYSNIVIQSDLTPLQRHHIKSLVQEKKERNHLAILCNEEPYWVIRNGRLIRKCDIWISLIELNNQWCNPKELETVRHFKRFKCSIFLLTMCSSVIIRIHC